MSVQQSWVDRDFVETLRLHIRALTDFVSSFEVNTRSRLAELGERLTNLERKVEFVEASLCTLHATQGHKVDAER